LGCVYLGSVLVVGRGLGAKEGDPEGGHESVGDLGVESRLFCQALEERPVVREGAVGVPDSFELAAELRGRLFPQLQNARSCFQKVRSLLAFHVVQELLEGRAVADPDSAPDGQHPRDIGLQGCSSDHQHFSDFGFSLGKGECGEEGGDLCGELWVERE